MPQELGALILSEAKDLQHSLRFEPGGPSLPFDKLSAGRSG